MTRPPAYHHAMFDPVRLADLKRGRRVSVCLPARDEAETVGPIVASIRAALADHVGLVDEVLVVDDGSADRTAAAARAAGARVVTANDVLPEVGSGTGKGEAMWKAVFAATGDLLVFCDADLRDFDPAFVTGLLGPLLTTDDVGLVKGCYERPLDGRPGEGGRVTELVARPLLSLLFPAVAGLAQPLAGELAARRQVLEQVPFVEGYGVDVALVIDVARRFGPATLAECDLGVRVHRNRPLEELAPQATEVMQAVLVRAGVALPSELAERPPWIDVPAYRKSA